VGISGGAWSGFPNDLADRDRLGLAGDVLFQFVLGHAFVRVHALVLVSAPLVVDGREKWRDSSELAMVFATFTSADH